MGKKRRRNQRSSIFRQKRVGKGGKEFELLKFRTMRFGAEAEKERLEKEFDIVFRGKLRFDPRVIPSKRWLRRFFIDELPQVVNIWRREMRLVGARPVPIKEFQKYPERIQEEYIKYAPALMDVLYAGKKFPETDKEVAALYERYFKRKKKKPLKTDFISFFKIMSSILFKGRRGL